MAYKCSFLDNEVYVAQDVNDIFARLTSGGVVFTDTGYTFGDLNATQSQTAEGGVTRDTNSCRVVKNGDTYKISKGACFMNDGSAIVFDSDGHEIEITSGSMNYVYLDRRIETNSIDIVVSELPGDESSIPLAEINEKGEIFDRRKYARAKIDLQAGGKLRELSVEFSQCDSDSSETVTIDMGDGDFNYAIMWEGSRTYSDSTHHREANGRNLIALEEGSEVRLSIGRFDGEEKERLCFKKDGQLLHIRLLKTLSKAKYNLNLGVI